MDVKRNTKIFININEADKNLETQSTAYKLIMHIHCVINISKLKLYRIFLYHRSIIPRYISDITHYNKLFLSIIKKNNHLPVNQHSFCAFGAHHDSWFGRFRFLDTDIPRADWDVRQLLEPLTRKFAREIIASLSSRYYSRFQFRRNVSRCRTARQDLFVCHVTQSATLGNSAERERESRSERKPYTSCTRGILIHESSHISSSCRADQVHRQFYQVAKFARRRISRSQSNTSRENYYERIKEKEYKVSIEESIVTLETVWIFHESIF